MSPSLIFDIRVAYALVHMTNPLIASMISVYPSSKWNDYLYTRY